MDEDGRNDRVCGSVPIVWGPTPPPASAIAGHADVGAGVPTEAPSVYSVRAVGRRRFGGVSVAPAGGRS